MDKTNNSVEKASTAKVEQGKSKTFFNPVVQPKLNVNKPGDAFETEADRMADQVMRKPASGNTFFTPAPNMIQREENKEPEDKTGDVLSEGAGLVWENLKLKPGFEAWKEQQTKELKYKLWESQPTDFKAGIVTFGLANLGILGSAFASDPGFRKDTIKFLDDKNLALPLSLIPYSEYFGLSSFKYQLPSATNAPYTFETELEFDAWFKLMREKWAIPQIGLSVGVDSSYSESGGFQPFTGGNVKLKFGGGIINVQGFYNQHLPPTPVLISDPSKGEAPTWLMRSLPSQLEENLPVGSGVFITVDVLRLPELFGAKSEPPPRATTRDDVSRKENSGSGGIAGNPAPSIVHDVLSSGGGSPLEHGTRSFMEDRFGQDFSNVRVHTNDHAADSAKAIDAKAYTSGNNIVFDNGQYNPGSQSGQTLLAHELAHVVQQSGSIQRKENPKSAQAPPPSKTTTPPAKTETGTDTAAADDDADKKAVKEIQEQLGFGNYRLAYLRMMDHLQWEKGAMKKWLADHDDVRKAFLKNLPATVITDLYTPDELVQLSSVTAFAHIDRWHQSEQEKTLLYTQNLPVFDHILKYISPYTGEPMSDVIENLMTAIKSKEYKTDSGNNEFHIINLLAPGAERKIKFYRRYEPLFKLVVKKFDPFTGLSQATFEKLTDTNSVDRDTALEIYRTLKYLDEEQRRAFLETALFAGTLEADKDAQAFFKKNFGAQYKALPHNWDFAFLPWNWGEAPFADRLTVDHIALMSSALRYDDKTAHKFGFDKGIEMAPFESKGKMTSHATKLIENLQDDNNFNNPKRLTLLLAIGTRAGMEAEIIAKVFKPKEAENKISDDSKKVIREYGFIPEQDFKYAPVSPPEVVYDKSIVWYGAKRTIFGGKESSIIGEHRATFDLRTLQETSALSGSLGPVRFGRTVYQGDKYYNNEWLENQINNNAGSETLRANLNEFKDGDRQGKLYASIRADVRQANIYASSLPIVGVNYFAGGAFYRSGAGVLQGLAINLSWSKNDPEDPANTINLVLGIENVFMNDFQMVSPKGTIAIGQIGMKGLRLTIGKNEIAEGLFLGMFKSADLTMKTLSTLLPNVLKLLPYAVMTMTEEFKGVKAHVYKDTLGALMQHDFGGLTSSLTFTSLIVRNLYDTAAGFLDDFTIAKRDKDNNLIRQGLILKETPFWTIDAAHNIKGRLKTIERKIRAMKAEIGENTLDKTLNDLEDEQKQLINIAAEKGIRYEPRDKEMNRLRDIPDEIRKYKKELEEKFEANKEGNILYRPLEFKVLEAEKAALEKDLEYLDKQYYDDKKYSESDNDGIARYEARKRRAEFEAKYRSFDVDLALRGIELQGGGYVRDLINDSLISMGFVSPKLEGLENVKIGAVDSSFTASGKGVVKKGDKPGVAVRDLQIPLLTGPGIYINKEGFRLETDNPRLENIFVTVSIDFSTNPLDKDPNKLYKYKLSKLWIGHAVLNGLRVFVGKDAQLPMLDFPSSVPVEAWGIHLWDYDPDKGDVNLRIRDIKARGTYQDKNETDKTSKEIGFGIDTTLDNTTEAGKQNAFDVRYKEQEGTVTTKLNIASAWIDALNLQSPTLRVSSLPGVKAIEVKNIQADIKVWIGKDYADLDFKTGTYIDINSLHIDEISAQGIRVLMSEEFDAATTDPTKKKTQKPVQEVTLPEKDKVFIRDINVAGLRVGLEESGITLATTGTEDASVKLGKTDLSNTGYKEKIGKTRILKSLSVHTAKFDKFTLEALGRNGRTYTMQEFLKFFGRTRLEGLDVEASFSDGINSGTIGVKGQTKKVPKSEEHPKGIRNVPISIDYIEGKDGKPDYYAIRIPLARINVPALKFKKGDHEITIPKATDPAKTSHLSDIDARINAHVEFKDDKPVYDIFLEKLSVADFIVYGMKYENKTLGIEAEFDKVTGLHIPNIEAGGFRLSSAKGFDVFGSRGGYVDAAQGTELIEAGFEKISAAITDGTFLAEKDSGRAAFDIDIASFGYTQDKDGNMAITLGAIHGGFPRFKIRQTDKATGITTETIIKSVDKTVNADKVVIHLNADKTQQIDVEKLIAGGLTVTSTEYKGYAAKSISTINLGPSALGADTATVKMKDFKPREIELKGIRGGQINAAIVSAGKGGPTVKNINLPNPDAIKVESLKIEIDDKNNKTITLVKPSITNFQLRMPDTKKIGDYTNVFCDLLIDGELKLGDGDFKTLALGTPFDAFVVNVPGNIPVQVKNLRLEYKDTKPPKPKAAPAKNEEGLTADQSRLLELEKVRDDTAEKLADTPATKKYGKEYFDNPAYEPAKKAAAEAKKAYDEQRAKMIGAAKAEAAKSSAKRYIDAVQGTAKAKIVVFDTVLEVNVETHKGEKYIQIDDELVQKLKALITSIIGTTALKPFWSSEEMKKIGRALDRWYTWAVPSTKGLIKAIASGSALGSVLVFLEKTDISKGTLKEDPSIFGLNFNINTSWGLDISGYDKFGVGLCEQKYKHPEKDNFYNLWGFVEYLGFVSPALVSRSGQKDAERMQRLKDKANLTEKQLEDLSIGDAVFELVAFIKYNLGLEAENLKNRVISEIKGVMVTADVSLSPQDVITELLKENKAGTFKFGTDKTIDDLHIEGAYSNLGTPRAAGTIGGGADGKGIISIPGAEYNSQDGNTKVVYDALEITPVLVTYKDDVYKLLNDNIQVKGLKVGIKK